MPPLARSPCCSVRSTLNVVLSRWDGLLQTVHGTTAGLRFLGAEGRPIVRPYAQRQVVYDVGCDCDPPLLISHSGGSVPPTNHNHTREPEQPTPTPSWLKGIRGIWHMAPRPAAQLLPVHALVEEQAEAAWSMGWGHGHRKKGNCNVQRNTKHRGVLGACRAYCMVTCGQRRTGCCGAGAGDVAGSININTRRFCIMHIHYAHITCTPACTGVWMW